MNPMHIRLRKKLFSRHSAALVVGVLGTIAGSATLQTLRSDSVVGGRYESANGASVVVKGLCSITPGHVSCWDLSGKIDPQLTRQVLDCFASQNHDVEFQFHRKTRYVIVRVASGGGFSFSDSHSRFVPTTYLSSSGSGNIQALMLATEPTEKEGSIVCSIGNDGQETAGLVALRPGSRVEILGGAFEFGAVTPLAPKDALGQWPLMKWRIQLNRIGEVDPNWSLSCSAIGKGGYTIVGVERGGKVVTTPELLRTEGPNQAYNYSVAANGRQQPQFLFHRPSGADGKWFLDTNVDPAKIESVRFHASRTARVVLAGFPMDPKE